MTLNAVIALILRFSPNSTDLQVDYITVVEYHHHHHHHADIYNAPITTKQEHKCSTKIQIVVDETY